MGYGNINTISYNIKGIQKYHKRNKIFDSLKKNVNPNGLIFLQEKDSSFKEKNFKEQLFSSHSKTNCCGVIIRLLWDKNNFLIK